MTDEDKNGVRRRNLALGAILAVAALGMYRFFYILNWIYRYQVDGKYCLTQILSGCLQTGFYCDFLYRYYVALKEGKSVIELPI